MQREYAHLIRPLIAFLHDLAMAAAAFTGAILLRLGLEDGWDRLTVHLEPALALFTGVAAATFLGTGLYRGIWRYASLNDLMAIARAATLAVLIFVPLAFLLTRLEALPRSSLVIAWLLLMFLLGAPRMLYRVVRDRGIEHLLERDRHLRVPALLVGTRDAAETFLREMARDRSGPYEVVGLIDDKGTRIGRRLHGVPVLGGLDALPTVIEQAARRSGRRPQRLILSELPARPEIARLLELAEAEGLAIARLPRLAELEEGVETRLEPRPIAIEDLLGRPQTKLDRAAMARLVYGRRVAVTGAGGSIGAELTRQIAALGPAELTLIDASEFNLYTIDLEIGETWPALPRQARLLDVRDAGVVERALRATRPELLFHAAALKHVPLVEANPLEGIATNVLGTRNVADACRAAGVAAMVQVSTDKAINPTSVMGASKRLAESYCQALDIAGRREGPASTRFVTVRFGNVLGSTGSVVPLFQRQIARGGPVTVTDPEMTRYFMTTKEAVELVLEASALGLEAPAQEAGRIYVLDMGTPVKILDLARQMIRLSGKRPGEDVEIVFTGLRPGEKLFEELFHHQEDQEVAGHPGLRLAAVRTVNLELLARRLNELTALVANGDREASLALLRRLVPEYSSAARPGGAVASAAS